MGATGRRRPRPSSALTRSPAPLLVVAAYAPELAALGHALPRHAAAVTTAEVGIGAVEAAAGAARVLATIRPARLLLVGTAGLYPGARSGADWAIGKAVVVRRMALASLGVARDSAYLPRLMPARAQSDPRLRREITVAAALSSADVACPLGISSTLAAARLLGEATGAQLENLEAFAVARAAAAAGIPFAAVLGIANQVGPRAHLEWRAHGAAAAAAACAAVIQLLDAGGEADVREPSRQSSRRR
jgi:nucleoside phosphorylase